MPIKPLSGLRPREVGIIERLESSDETSLKLMELGLGPGEPVSVLHRAPFGGPIVIEVMGYRLSIRKSDADQIFVRSDKE